MRIYIHITKNLTKSTQVNVEQASKLIWGRFNREDRLFLQAEESGTIYSLNTQDENENEMVVVMDVDQELVWAAIWEI